MNKQSVKPVSQKKKKYDHLTEEDFEDELDHRQFSIFWDGLDIANSKKALLKLFMIRLIMIAA